MTGVKFGLRGGFAAEGTGAGADAFMAECRQMYITADPGGLDESTLVQGVVSLAVQRICEWAHRHRSLCAEDPDAVPSQTIVGALTGVAIGVDQFGYDIDDVILKGIMVMKVAAKDLGRADLGQFKTPTNEKN